MQRTEREEKRRALETMIYSQLLDWPGFNIVQKVNLL
jgi:hypothetical protein